MLNRRDLIKLGGAAYLASALPRARATGPSRGKPRRLIIVFATGAWDTTYALDPKEPSYADVPVGAVKTFGGLDVYCDASRPSVTAFFDKYAAVSAIVRGVATDAINHFETQRRIATGTREETRPDFGAIVAHDLGAALPIPYLILGDVAFAGEYNVMSARVGSTNQIVGLMGGSPNTDPNAQGTATDPTGAIPDLGPSTAEAELLRRYSLASVDRARATRGALGYNRRRVDDFAEAIDRSDKLRALGGLGQRGDAASFDAQIGIALDALQQDLSQAVMLNTRQGWDTHSDNYLQAISHEATFGGLTKLVDGLASRPGRQAGTTMLDDTVVAVISEMSRTPRLAGDPAHLGKGHWPLTSELVIGAGVAGGRVFGSTTPDMQGVVVDLATGAPLATGMQPMYSHFVAGVLALCGVDSTSHLNVPAYDAFVAT
jgi:uncharacterized protein (DUF1501 family)